MRGGNKGKMWKSLFIEVYMLSSLPEFNSILINDVKMKIVLPVKRYYLNILPLAWVEQPRAWSVSSGWMVRSLGADGGSPSGIGYPRSSGTSNNVSTRIVHSQDHET